MRLTPHPPGLFLEHAHVFGNVYGTSLAAVKCVSETRKVCILDVDIQGAASVKRANVGAAFVFIAPPSMAALEERLRGRGTETEDKVRSTELSLWRAPRLTARPVAGEAPPRGGGRGVRQGGGRWLLRRADCER